jgi:hypothetical protein
MQIREIANGAGTIKLDGFIGEARRAAPASRSVVRFGVDGDPPARAATEPQAAGAT